MRLKLFILFLLLYWAVSFVAMEDLTEIKRLRETADSLHSVGRTDSAAIVGQRAIELALKI